MGNLFNGVVAVVACALIPLVAVALEPFQHTITGETLDLSTAPQEGRDTEAVRRFLETGVNLYNEVADALAKGEQLFLSACSGCHGQLAEGKMGPGLNDNYWTYEKNKTDKGLFETAFGGAQGMMGTSRHPASARRAAPDHGVGPPPLYRAHGRDRMADA